MTEAEGRVPQLSPDDVARELRQLALVDRVLGLEAEVARLSARAPYTSAREEVERLQAHLEAVYQSPTWKVGTAVLRPFKFLLRRR